MLKTKEFKRLERKISQLTQEAYIKLFLDLFNKELSKAVFKEDVDNLKQKWSTIANQLEQGYILNPEELK
jgi:transcription elongation factor GreA-like protein